MVVAGNRLIDIHELAHRVENILDIDVQYISFIEAIKLLCDECDLLDQENQYLRQMINTNDLPF